MILSTLAPILLVNIFESKEIIWAQKKPDYVRSGFLMQTHPLNNFEIQL